MSKNLTRLEEMSKRRRALKIQSRAQDHRLPLDAEDSEENFRTLWDKVREMERKQNSVVTKDTRQGRNKVFRTTKNTGVDGEFRFKRGSASSNENTVEIRGKNNWKQFSAKAPDLTKYKSSIEKEIKHPTELTHPVNIGIDIVDPFLGGSAYAAGRRMMKLTIIPASNTSYEHGLEHGETISLVDTNYFTDTAIDIDITAGSGATFMDNPKIIRVASTTNYDPNMMVTYDGTSKKIVSILSDRLLLLEDALHGSTVSGVTGYIGWNFSGDYKVFWNSVAPFNNTSKNLYIEVSTPSAVSANCSLTGYGPLGQSTTFMDDDNEPWFEKRHMDNLRMTQRQFELTSGDTTVTHLKTKLNLLITHLHERLQVIEELSTMEMFKLKDIEDENQNYDYLGFGKTLANKQS